MNIDTNNQPGKLFGIFFRSSSSEEESTNSSCITNEQKLDFLSVNNRTIKLCAKRSLNFFCNRNEYVPIAIRNTTCYIKIEDFINKELVSQFSFNEIKTHKKSHEFLLNLFKTLLINEIYYLFNSTLPSSSKDNNYSLIQTLLDSHDVDIYHSAEEIISIIMGLKTQASHLDQTEILSIATSAIKSVLSTHKVTAYPLSLLNKHYYSMLMSKNYTEDEIAPTIQHAYMKMLQHSHLQRFLSLGIHSDCALSFFIEAERLRNLLEEEFKAKELSDEAAKTQADLCFAHFLDTVLDIQPTERMTLESGFTIMRIIKEFLTKEKGDISKSSISIGVLWTISRALQLQWNEIIALTTLYKYNCSIQKIQDLLLTPYAYKARLIKTTFMKIAAHLNANGMKKEIYCKREGGKLLRTTFAFAITQDDIYIVIKDGWHGTIGVGASKEVSIAISLCHPDKEFVRAKSKFPKKAPPKKKISTVEGMQYERQFLLGLHASLPKEEARYFAPPHTAAFSSPKESNNPRCILFQEKMNHSGNNFIKKWFNKHSLYATRDCAQAFSILHHRKFVHLDGKWANILIQGDCQNDTTPVQAKLTDFEFTCPIGKSANCGTYHYLSPEQLKGVNDKQIRSFNASPKHDSFALGIMICQIAGQIDIPQPINGAAVSFGELSENSLNDKIAHAKRKISSNQPQNYANTDAKEAEKQRNIKIQMLDIAIDLVKTNPEERLSCQDAALKLNQLIESNYPSA